MYRKEPYTIGQCVTQCQWSRHMAYFPQSKEIFPIVKENDIIIRSLN